MPWSEVANPGPVSLPVRQVAVQWRTPVPLTRAPPGDAPQRGADRPASRAAVAWPSGRRVSSQVSAHLVQKQPVCGPDLQCIAAVAAMHGAT